MSANQETSNRKNDHIKICLNEEVDFVNKSSGFEKYSFEHNAATEVDPKNINLKNDFLGKMIDYPFMISSMTGGSENSLKLNEELAIIANELNIPIGVGSQRQAIENKSYHNSYKILREKACSVPVLANIGAAQIAKGLSNNDVDLIIDLIEADAMIIHLNPLQELVQKNGEVNFKGLLINSENIINRMSIPVIIKEVGSGISKSVAEKFLSIGAKGIDVAGAGGTSWAAVEYLRNKNTERPYWNWGLPTSYCLRTVRELKSYYEFSLIGSGGIKSGEDIAKAIALGADITSAANTVLRSVYNNGIDDTIELIKSWFDTLKDIMYLTGAENLSELKNVKLIKDGDIY